jgi:hypothetical protein
VPDVVADATASLGRCDALGRRPRSGCVRSRPSLPAWRDEIAAQLAPGAPIHTLEVFAARLKVSPAEFRHVLDSPQEMQKQVFVHLRPGCVEQFYADALSKSVRLIKEYMGGA